MSDWFISEGSSSSSSSSTKPIISYEYQRKG